MKKLYEIRFSSVYSRLNGDDFFAFVYDEVENVKQVCEDMSKYHSFDIMDEYSFQPAKVEVVNENGEYFDVHFMEPQGISTEYNNDYVIKCDENYLKEKIEFANSALAGKKVFYYDNVKLLSADQVWEVYRNNMKSLNINIDNYNYRQNNQTEQEEQVECL